MHAPDLHIMVTGLKRLVCAVGLTATLTGPAMAQSDALAEGVYRSGAERIDASDNIRRLSQQIAAAVCLMDADVNTVVFTQIITDAMAEYERLMTALTTGDPALEIFAPEEDRRLLSVLRGLSLQWDRYNQATSLRLSGGVKSDGVDYISRQNLNVMHSAKYALSEVINDYTIPPALLQGDAFTLNIAVRQRSLSQQIAKEACGVITGNQTMGQLGRLERATNRFDASHQALLNGFSGAGVSPPPTAEIAAGLTEITARWNAVKSDLAAAPSQSDPSAALSIYEQLDDISVRYDALVALYVEDSKSGL